MPDEWLIAMSEYPADMRFTIHSNDVGCEAYRDGYVEWLEARVKKLTEERDREKALRECYKCLPEEYHRGMLELLVKAAFEAAEISHGRAAELLGCSVVDIRERGWVQGKHDEEIHRLRSALKRIDEVLLDDDGFAQVAEVQEILREVSDE